MTLFLDDDGLSKNCYRASLFSSYFSTLEKDCMLWHFCPGHPNFQYITYLFPNLFNKVDASSMFCDVCIL